MLKNSIGCGNLARLYTSGEGVRQSYEKALNFFQKGCELGDSRACFLSAFYYEEGMGVQKSLKKSNEYMDKSSLLSKIICSLTLASTFTVNPGPRKLKVINKPLLIK